MKLNRQVAGQVVINLSFSRHLGPRFDYGSVQLQLDSSQPYSFTSTAEWPDTANYEANVKAGVEKALKEIIGSLEATRIKLLAIDFDDIDSTSHRFESAAYAATCAAFLTWLAGQDLMMIELLKTPFHERTSRICLPQNWRRWAGYIAAGSYELTLDREYWAIRNAAALIDVTPLMKYIIKGRDASRLLNRVITRDMDKLKVGQVYYTPWCDEEGKIIDDGTISRLDEGTYRMTSADPSLRWLSMNAVGLDVVITEVTGRVAALSFQGPNTRPILNRCCEASVDGLKYFRVMQNKLKGLPVTISRTGYTGDLGYEIWMEAKDALPAWDALMDAGQDYGITPVGILAMDMARVEAGLFMIEVDYTSTRQAWIEAQKSSPFELGLDWTVALDKKGYFVGRRALEREKRADPVWKLMGLEVEWNGMENLFADVGLPPQIPGMAVRGSLPVFVGSAQVGYASTSTWSPLLKKYIALAHLQKPYFEPGTDVRMEITVEHHRQHAPAKVVKLPFYEPEWKKK